MIQKFEIYIKEKNLFHPSDKILLTVSGGKDSVFMVNLFLKANFNFGIAHCNFKLRGDDADLDEQFVKKLAYQNDISYHTTSFNTQKYSEEEGISIQMAARELRYTWFEKIRKEHNYNYIATAHHKNDVAETMLINLVKGTGLSGLHGISSKRGYLIRPILNFSRKEIDQYVMNHKVSYREDQSNSDVKYTRNRIRHAIIPELEKINPSVIETLNIEAGQFLELEKIISDKIEEERERLFRDEKGMIAISIDELKKLTPLTSYLYLLLKDYGFNKSDVNDIVQTADGNSGKRFCSSTHELIKDRGVFLLQKIKIDKPELFIINELVDFKKSPIAINSILENNSSDIELQKLKEFAYLDFEKIQFPIILRKWREGDVFQPYGMIGKKKVSDYLIDNKIPLLIKREKWVLEANGQIIWLVGERIDDRYKLTAQSKSVLILQMMKEI